MGPYIPCHPPRSSLICEEVHDSVDPWCDHPSRPSSRDMIVQFSQKSLQCSLCYLEQQQGNRAMKFGSISLLLNSTKLNDHGRAQPHYESYRAVWSDDRTARASHAADGR